jgi:MoaA/NifB/PqqE/SkfB family radical SAM enzyme
MFEKYFCSSPWIHMRIENNGNFAFCRWQKEIGLGERINIKNTTPLEYFQKHMSGIRQQLLNGEKILQCGSCHVMEEHKKISGRQKQLLKIGVVESNFAKSLRASPLFQKLEQSYNTKGKTDLLPVDWQIDLGNFCNSACIMCSPEYSSKLANEWYDIGLIDKPYYNRSWAQEEKLLEKFINSLTQIKNLQYLHFLGGETLITPAFKKMLEALIKAELNENLIIGFTTNLTVWPKDVIDLLKKFKNVHVGLSIETLNSVNDYIRWPSKISIVKENLNKFIQLSNDKNWFTSLRVTPNIFSILYLDEIYKFAMDNNVAVESCNFIYRPSYLKLDLLPKYLRDITVQKLKKILYECEEEMIEELIVNIRRKEVVKNTIINDIKSVINYLETKDIDTNEYDNLVMFLKKIEDKRKNKITEYVPEYENFLRHIGY